MSNVQYNYNFYEWSKIIKESLVIERYKKMIHIYADNLNKVKYEIINDSNDFTTICNCLDDISYHSDLFVHTYSLSKHILMLNYKQHEVIIEYDGYFNKKYLDDICYYKNDNILVIVKNGNIKKLLNIVMKNDCIQRYKSQKTNRLDYQCGLID